MLPGRLVDDDGLDMVVITGRVASELARHLNRVTREARRDGCTFRPDTIATVEQITSLAIGYHRRPAFPSPEAAEARTELVEQARSGDGSPLDHAISMLVDVNEAATRIGVGPRQVRHLLAAHTLTNYPSARGRQRLDVAEIDSYIAHRRHQQ